MKEKIVKIVHFTGIILLFCTILIAACKKSFTFETIEKSSKIISGLLSKTTDTSKLSPATPTPKPLLAHPQKPKYVRGIHLTPWVTGSARARERINKLLDETEINTVVIAIKESNGEVYLPGVKQADEYKTYVFSMPDVASYVAYLKKRKIYTVARIVVFKDTMVIAKKPEWAIKDKQGKIWKDFKGNSWASPYNKEVWNYNLNIAKHALEIGFDEIQFDYIRFPSDGKISQCWYGHAYSSSSAVGILSAFLKDATTELKGLGANVSIDLFGLATTDDTDMGIGQNMVALSKDVDFISPMVYPSHYRPTTYGLAVPDSEPYSTVFCSLYVAKKRLGSSYTKLRPYLQDFSIKKHYSPEDVKAQIQACYDNDIYEWILWSPSARYQGQALHRKGGDETFTKSKKISVKTNYQYNYVKAAEKAAALTIEKSSATAVEISTSSAIHANHLQNQTTAHPQK